MNIELTNFLIKYPKFDFLKACLDKLEYINSTIPIYRNKNDYFFYIGKNEKEYLFLYGTFSKVIYNKMVIMYSAWYKNIEFKENELIINRIIYNKINKMFKENDYIMFNIN